MAEIPLAPSLPASGADYAFSPARIAPGLNYGASRSRQGGGLGSRAAGTGAGGRHGMAAGASRGLGRKVKPLKLRNGTTVHVDILCGTCGYEQPPNHCRLRCDNCGLPLTLLEDEEAYAGKHTLENYTSQEAFTPASLERHRQKHRLSRSSGGGAYTDDVEDDDDSKSNNNGDDASVASRSSRRSRSGRRRGKLGGVRGDSTRATDAQRLQLVTMAATMNAGATARKRALGGLGNKRAGLGAGARHGMSAGAVAHLPASTRAIRLGTGDVITVDVLCRSCGYEQPPDWHGLRCQNCRLPLNQLGSLHTDHEFRAIGWKQAASKWQREKRQAEARRLGNRGGRNRRRVGGTEFEDGNTARMYGMSGGMTVRSIVSGAQLAGRVEAEQARQERAEARRIAKANLPSLGNLRAETNDVVGDWVCAIETGTGKNYFYNKRTHKVQWEVPPSVRPYI